MIADIPDTDTDTLEEAGFAIEGVAQTLYAMSTSEACRDMAMALDLLAKTADGALAAVKAHVAARCAENRHTASLTPIGV